MRNLATTGALVDLPAANPGSERLLDLDADVFRANFHRVPFLIEHHLCDHPLFALPRLMELARTLPEDKIEYNAGTLPVNQDPKLTPRNGLSIEETIRRIEECKSWMVLKYVEHDPEYRDLLYRCLAEVRAHSEAICPGMMQPESFIFLSSPGAVTPYHMDPEHNFLLQIRGSKTVRLYDGRDRSLVTEEDLERFLGGGHRNMKLDEANRERAWVFEMKPGTGLHFPVTYPHWVEVGPTVSVSFSITFRTPDLERRSCLYTLNRALRQRGWHPRPVGASPWRDSLKYQAYRVWRKTRRLLGKEE